MTVRLFIAIRLSDAVKRSITELQDSFRRQRIGGNYTPKENLHLTLAFIGEYGDPERVMELLQELSFSPFTLETDRPGSFDSLWWTGIKESRELENLVRSLRHSLADAGIPFDRKRFTPHITILRKPTYGKEGIPQVGMKAASMRVERVSLMQSVRGKNGMIYTELGFVEAEQGEKHVREKL